MYEYRSSEVFVLSHIIIRILKLFPLHYPHLTKLVEELVVVVVIALSLI